MQSQQTLDYIVYSFIEVVPYLLSLNGAKFIFSDRFNQDNVDIFFGQQRARCGRGDSPTLTKLIMYNTQTIRSSWALSFGTSANIKKKLVLDINELSEPLRKRKLITKEYF